MQLKSLRGKPCNAFVLCSMLSHIKIMISLAKKEIPYTKAYGQILSMPYISHFNSSNISHIKIQRILVIGRKNKWEL